MSNVGTSGKKSAIGERMRFSEQEDDRIRELVAVYGVNNWIQVGKLMPTRNARQCRERYKNYLRPTLNRGEWTKEEDDKLLELWKMHGKQWNMVGRRFPNRSDDSIRNRLTFLKKQQMAMEVNIGREIDRRRRVEEDLDQANHDLEGISNQQRVERLLAYLELI